MSLMIKYFIRISEVALFTITLGCLVKAQPGVSDSLERVIDQMNQFDPIAEPDSILLIGQSVLDHPGLHRVNDTSLFLVYFKFAIAQQYKAEYLSKLQFLEKADSLLNFITDKEFVIKYKPSVAFNIGVTYNSLRNFEKALSYFIKVRTEYAREIDNQMLGKCFSSEAISHKRLGAFEQAEQRYLKAIDIFKKSEDSALSLATAYNNLGMFYKDVRKQEALAIEYFKSSSSIYLEELDTFNERLVTPTTLIGVTLCQQNKLEEALPYFELAEKILHKIANPDNIQFPIYFGDLAICYLNNDKFDEALTAFKKGLKLLHYSPQDPYYSHFSPHPYLPMNTLAWIHWTYQRRYDQYEGDDDLDSALIYADYTLDIMERLVESYQLEQSQSLFIKEKAWVFNNYLLDLWRKWEVTRDEKFVYQALEVMDRIKNLKYRDQLWKKDVMTQQAGKDELDRAFALKEEINHLQKKLTEMISEVGRENDSLLIFQGQLAQLKNSYEEILTAVTKESLKNPPLFPTLLQIRQKALGDHSALIAYFLRGSHYAVVTITRDSVWMDMLGDPGQQTLEEFRSEVANSSGQMQLGDFAFESISKVIYDSLVNKPVAHLGKNITAVHLGLDGLLSLIPFESIKMNEAQGSGYFMERYDVSYFTEVSTLTNDPSGRVQKVAIYAPAYQRQMVDTTTDMALAQLVRSGYYELPGAAFESLQIVELTNGRLFTGTLANETAFRDLAPDYDILHLSMHGLIDDEHPFLSSLLFDQTNDKYNDGFLRVGEIHQLDLGAKMVVLSACNTGYGQIRQGEGVVSIAQAFQYAGVPTALMSLWKVPDQSTSVIMQEFYRGLKKGLTKDRALTDAKRHFLKTVSDPNLKHPYYWAGFVLQGDTSSLQFAGGFPWEFLLFDFMAISLILVYRWRRSKAHKTES